MSARFTEGPRVSLVLREDLNLTSVQYPDPAHLTQPLRPMQSLSLLHFGPFRPRTHCPSDLDMVLGDGGGGGRTLLPVPPHSLSKSCGDASFQTYLPFV